MGVSFDRGGDAARQREREAMVQNPPCLLIIDPDEAFGAALAEAAQSAGLLPVRCRTWWEAKPLVDGAVNIGAMAVELVQSAGMPNGVSVALMAQARRPKLPVLFMCAKTLLLKDARVPGSQALAKSVGAAQLAACALEMIERGERRPRPKAMLFIAPSQALGVQARYRLDAGTRFRSVNDTALVLWNMDRGDLLGRPLLEVFPQLIGQPKLRAHMDVLVTGSPFKGVMTSVILRQPIAIRISADRTGLKVKFEVAA
jgi:hypothetical protein